MPFSAITADNFGAAQLHALPIVSAIG